MKKALCVAILSLIAVCAAFCISIRKAEEVHPFDSVPMLETYYDETDDGYASFWDNCEISLLTISSGGPLYSWFGHSAFLVSTPDGRNITFDYGTFSFNDEDFFINFAFGRLWFLCLSSNAAYQLAEIEDEGRSVTKVVLPFTSEQKKAVVGFLNANTRSENRVYLYHHYEDNCATRLRDIIDRTTDGAFKAWAESISGLTFRQQASRALSKNPFVLWGLDFLQSASIDRSATLWDEMFLPEMLEKGVLAFYGLEKETILDNSGTYCEVPAKPQNNILFSLIFGLVLGGISFALLLVGFRKAHYIYSGIVEIIFGILGTVLFFMMTFTNHDVTWFNENIIFINPLLIVLAVFSFMACGKKADKWGRVVSISHKMLFGLILLLVILKLIAGNIFFQQNWNIIITMALFYLPGILGSILTKKGEANKKAL
ncbi:MAG: DUF4105 domain-containing protein [Spirochaetales bacterium]|nr:DUF4105 domain-containing protein [Spirochaetales bacterium]